MKDYGNEFGYSELESLDEMDKSQEESVIGGGGLGGAGLDWDGKT